MIATVGETLITAPCEARQICRLAFSKGGRDYTIEKLADQDWGERSKAKVRGAPSYWRPLGGGVLEIWPEPDKDYALSAEVFIFKTGTRR